MKRQRTLTVKLEPELEQALCRYCCQGGISIGVVVKKRAFSEYLAKEPPSGFEAGKDLFGRHGSGARDLSTRRHQYFTEAVDAKHRCR